MLQLGFCSLFEILFFQKHFLSPITLIFDTPHYEIYILLQYVWSKSTENQHLSHIAITVIAFCSVYCSKSV